MSSVIEETVHALRKQSPIPWENIWVDDLAVGVFFTGVKLSNGHAGVAFTPVGEIPEAVCCPTTAARMPQAGSLDRIPVSTLADFALDKNVLKTAIGVAALNALTQTVLASGNKTGYRIIEGEDGFDLLEIQPRETVCLVGAFGPYIRRLKTMGNPFFILEKSPQTLRPEEIQFFRPPSEMEATLGQADVAILTGTAIVNHSIDSLLNAIPKGKRAALIGPTSSLLPDAFFKRNVQIMAGLRIGDPDLMIKILKQGGSGYHLLQQCAEKIAFVKG
jgi:uncharacterized protein (DUF4213/DUF364 family)